VAEALANLGAESVVAATTCIVDVEGDERAALRDALLSAASYEWILFTSANGVRACERILREAGRAAEVLVGPKIASMGEATGAALVDCGLQPALQATTGTSEDLARRILAEDSKAPQTILFPRARDGREEAAALLEAAGCQLHLRVAYTSKPVDALDPAWIHAQSELSAGTLDGVAFFAPSQVHALLELYPEAVEALAKLQVIAAIGGTTAAAVEALGLQVHAVADAPTSADIADKILQAFS
jgi:uroporphyrinogen-III synthase